MKKKTAIYIGVGCGGFIVIAVIVGIIIATSLPKMVAWVGQQAAAEQERQEIADNWQPPPQDAAPGTFFPKTVAGYTLAAHDDDAAVPELGIDREGWHASYESGGSQIDVYVYQANELEAEALFERVHDVYEEQDGGYKRITDVGYRLYYASSKHHQNHLWRIKGWLFVFRSQDSEDREPFIKTFLQTTSDEEGASPNDTQSDVANDETDADPTPTE